MKSETQVIDWLRRFHYDHTGYVFYPERGYIVWRTGAGENIEILKVETAGRLVKAAPELLREMIRSLENDMMQPSHTVFAFNESSAIECDLYRSLRFRSVNTGVFGDINRAVLHWCDWHDLKDVLFDGK